MAASARPYIVYIDGGARNNPGPAAIGVVLYERGELEAPAADPAASPVGPASTPAIAPAPRAQIGLYIGEATNNVAEYFALLRGLEEAAAAGATEVEIRSDSELLVKQMNGEYKVKNEGLRPLHGRARALSLRVPTRFVHIPREQNRIADGLVNRALDEWERRQTDERQGGGEKA